MAASLLDAVRGHPFLFVVGKGGVGKTTAAASVALGLADHGERTHLISTDPAHSLADFFGQPVGGAPRPSACCELLLLEEFDAGTYAREWAAAAGPQLLELIEGGTYLRAAEAGEFLDLSVPGVDEIMAAFRLTDLVSGGHTVVVDTAPMGHTLRLLDSGDVIDGWTVALRAMADKAAVVASSLTGMHARLSAEALLDRVEAAVRAFREHVLARASFLIVHRGGLVVQAETRRLLEALQVRRLHVGAAVATGAGAPLAGPPAFVAPLLDAPTGCAGARAWVGAVRAAGGAVAGDASAGAAVADAAAGDAREWLLSLTQRWLLFAGKGGVGKSTCAAAAAIGLARTRRVLLCSTDPAGSLADLLEMPVPAEGVVLAPSLRVLQIDAPARLAALRERYREEVREVFARVGLDAALRMDRAVIERLWNLAPPGIDEVVALIELTDALDRGETLVLDPAPTGHFLRLLRMPGLARDWTRALMRVFQQLRAPGLDETVDGLIRFSKRLKQLELELKDPAAAGVVLVTLSEPMVRAGTARLRARLGDAGVSVLATIVNRVAPQPPAVPAGGALAGVVIAAPDLVPPPVGRAALHRFLDTWRILR
jgi:arsenite-transporting ATPase